VPLASWLCFTVLMSSSLCAPQLVSAPRCLAYLRCPDKSISLHPTVGECSSLSGFFPCPEEFLALRSTVGECPSLSVFHSPA
jgi:hypothetical protein